MLLRFKQNATKKPFGLSLSKPAHASVKALRQAQGERGWFAVNEVNVNNHLLTSIKPHRREWNKIKAPHLLEGSNHVDAVNE